MRKLIFLFFIPLILSSCSSGKRAYEQGDYYDAVVKAVNRLRSKPNHKKSKETLRNAYPLAVSTMEADARQALSSNSPLKSKNALRVYERLHMLHDEIRRSPGALRVIPNPNNYFNTINDLKPQAAFEAYNEAERFMAIGNRESAKQAYFLYLEANEFVPGYKDVVQKSDEALFEATLKVLVRQIPVPTQYTLSSQFFQNKVEEFLQGSFNTNQFVRFYTPEAAEKTDLPYIDHYIEIAFDDFSVGNTFIQEKEEILQKDSVEIAQIELEDGSKKPVYGTVNAKLTRFRKQVVSNGLLSLQIRDAHTNAVLSTEKFNGEFIWFSEWGFFNGDERALDEEHLQIVQQREVPPPPPQDMFIEFTRPIYNQLTRSLDNFYRRF